MGKDPEEFAKEQRLRVESALKNKVKFRNIAYFAIMAFIVYRKLF